MGNAVAATASRMMIATMPVVMVSTLTERGAESLAGRPEAGQLRRIFYGVEEIHTTNPVWHVFSAIKKLTPNLVQFYDLPPNKLHGVVTRVEL